MNQSTPECRWKCVCAYDGTRFSGWQSQPGGGGIQDVIEARLEKILQRPIRLHGSGRTDAGVHALGQVFHFDAQWGHSAEKLRTALRVGLPATIEIKSVAPVSADFHARFSAKGKRYSYRIYEGTADPFSHPFVLSRVRPRRLNIAAMQNAARILEGEHDFRGFAADNGAELENPVRDLTRVEVSAQDRSIKITFEANGFLYKMVRSLTGALLAVGESRLGLETLREILAEGRRTEIVETVPPQGLFLEEVFY